MPKATRAKDSNEAPKKRSRKAKPADGNGTEAAQPVAAAPAIAPTTSDVKVSESKALHGVQKTHVSEELVRRRAYELYLQRRGQGGSPEQDWFQALQEISSQQVA